MPTKPHGRKYDLVVFGATGMFCGSSQVINAESARPGYTGRYAAEYITKSLPTDLNWAIAGRSREKLEKIAAELKSLNTDRRQPGTSDSKVLTAVLDPANWPPSGGHLYDDTSSTLLPVVLMTYQNFGHKSFQHCFVYIFHLELQRHPRETISRLAQAFMLTARRY